MLEIALKAYQNDINGEAGLKDVELFFFLNTFVKY